MLKILGLFYIVMVSIQTFISIFVATKIEPKLKFGDYLTLLFLSALFIPFCIMIDGWISDRENV